MNTLILILVTFSLCYALPDHLCETEDKCLIGMPKIGNREIMCVYSQKDCITSDRRFDQQGDCLHPSGICRWERYPTQQTSCMKDVDCKEIEHLDYETVLCYDSHCAIVTTQSLDEAKKIKEYIVYDSPLYSPKDTNIPQ
jgi:hypothetical protein